MLTTTARITIPTTTTSPTTTTTPPTETTVPTATTEAGGGIADGLVDGVTDAVGDTADQVVDGAGKVVDVATQPLQDVAGSGFEALNRAAGEMAGSAFGDLAQVTLDVSDPEGVVIGPLTWSVHILAGGVAFAAIATTLLVMVLIPRKVGSRVIYLGESMIKFLLVSSLGVTIGVALVELSGTFTTEAITLSLPDEIDTEGANIYDTALAVVVVPLVGVAFGFQKFFLGILIAFWPLAAAVSIFRSFKHALPIFTALLVANVVWPPLAALAIGQAFAALPSVGTATWWCVAAVMIAPLANAIALAARGTS